MSQEREEVRDNLKALSAYLYESSGPDFMFEAVEQAIKLLEGWRPIETRPSAGVFLVWLDSPMMGSNVQVMRRRETITTIGHMFDFDVREKPTHWKPLPEPPTT